MKALMVGFFSHTALPLALLFTALFSPAEIRAASPPPELVQLSKLIHSSKYAEAKAYAVKLLKEKPDNIVLLRVKGVCEMELGKPTEAVRTLKHALTVDPDSISCRYYLAQAHAYCGSMRESIRLLEEIMTQAPESLFGQQAKAILPELSNMAETTSAIPDQKRWSIYASASADYDDNVPARADRDEDTSDTDSWRFTYSAYGEFKLLDQTIGHSPLTLGAGYSFYATEYADSDWTNYDVASHRGVGFLERKTAILSKFCTLRLEGSYVHTEVGDEPYSETVEGTAKLDVWWLRCAMLSTYYSYCDKDFEYTGDYPDYYNRDGDEWEAGIAQYLYVFKNRLRMGLSYAYRDNHSEGVQYALKSHNVGASLLAWLPLRFRACVAVSYQQEDYVDFVPDPRRLDDVWTYTASLARPIAGDSLEARLGYTAVRSGSNQDFAEYKRDVVSIGLSLSM